MSGARCLEWCRGKIVYIAEQCRTDAVLTKIQELGMQRRREPKDAQVLVTADPAVEMTRSRLRATACLLGSCFISPALLEGGQAGVAIKLHPAVSKELHLWVSPGCAAKYGELWGVIKHCMEQVEPADFPTGQHARHVLAHG